MIYINLIFEDALSGAVLNCLLEHSDKNYKVVQEFSRHGCGWIKKTVHGFNNASKGMPYLVLIDSDSGCPISVRNELFPCPLTPNNNMLFRIAVPEVEAWLLADRSNFSSFLGIDITRIPIDADSIPDAKRCLINLTKLSKRRDLKNGIVPAPRSSAKIGPYYNPCLIPFVNKYWNPLEACNASESLRRAIKAINQFEPVISVVRF